VRKLRRFEEGWENEGEQESRKEDETSITSDRRLRYTPAAPWSGDAPALTALRRPALRSRTSPGSRCRRQTDRRSRAPPERARPTEGPRIPSRRACAGCGRPALSRRRG